MDQEKEETPLKRRMTRSSRSARNRRIVEQAPEGLPMTKSQRQERLTLQHVRRIAVEALAGRDALEAAKAHRGLFSFFRFCVFAFLPLSLASH